jgi:hypothetical protein
MTRYAIESSILLLLVSASVSSAAPALSVVPEGILDDNWVWRIDLEPDFALSPGGSPLAFELGFRLTGAPLLSATIIEPSQFDNANPGNVIFGWEALTVLGGSGNCGSGIPGSCPVGLQVNTGVDEIFAAYGSIDFTTPGPRSFLKVVAQGPANGGAPISTIEWLGAYGGKGRIAQLTPNGPFISTNFDLYAGTATQAIPEPACGALITFGALTLNAISARRRDRPSGMTRSRR